MRTKAWSNCTFDEVCMMERDNIDVGGFGMLCDAGSDTVCLTDLQLPELFQVASPRETFNRLIREWQKPRALADL